jgi:DUF1365 family protein
MEYLKSYIYDCEVFHSRTVPVQNRFNYKIFNFYLNLEEVISQRSSWIFGYNRFSLVSLHDKDHMDFNKGDIQSNIIEYLTNKGINRNEIKTINLLTNLRIFGYVFNPVSFYFIGNHDGIFTHCLVEVGNTFGEQKPYIVHLDEKGEGVLKTPKEFYVSPFIPLDSFFIFKISTPSNHFVIEIDSLEKDGNLFRTRFSGNRVPLTIKHLLYRLVSFPFVTMKIIIAIHWQALKLFLKKVPYIEKMKNPELQKEVIINKRVIN